MAGEIINMSSYSDQIKEYVSLYKKEKMIDNAVINPHEVAAWAYSNGLHKPNTKTVIDLIAADISKVFREEYLTSPSGKRYRANHAVKQKHGDKQMSFWADIDDINAPEEHFRKAFFQRRQQIVGDCLQLKTDADVFNEKRQPSNPIQIYLDFNEDIAEIEFSRDNYAA